MTAPSDRKVASGSDASIVASIDRRSAALARLGALVVSKCAELDAIAREPLPALEIAFADDDGGLTASVSRPKVQ